mgnify:CR=1 FL=1
MKSESNFIRQNPCAIIANSNAPSATSTNFNVDITCPGVQRILNQFFYNGSWPFHDFSRCDLSDNNVG